MLEFSLCWFDMMADGALKVVLIAIIAKLFLALSRVQDSSIKHAVWLLVTGSLVVLPLLAIVSPTIAIPWPFALRNTATFTPTPLAKTTATATQPGLTPAASRQNRGTQEFPSPELQLASIAGSAIPHSAVTGETVAGEASQAVPSSTIISSSVDANPFSHVLKLQSWIPLLCGIWIVGTMVLLTRLIVSVWLTRRLVARSTSLRDQTIGDAAKTGVFGLRQTNVIFRESPLTTVPLTAGWMSPAILLPISWRDWSNEKREHVLIHELSHVRRSDCLTALLSEGITTFYWFHPLVWWLKRRLATLAEECCDDTAIRITGNRYSYARHLLEIASGLSRHGYRLNFNGLAMARGSQVERRILVILDPRRPLSQRLTRLTAVVLIAVALPVIAVAAALRPTTQSSTMTRNAVNAPTRIAPETQIGLAQLATDIGKSPVNPETFLMAQANPTPAATNESANLRVHGQITNSEGQPVAESFISVIGWRRTNDQGSLPETWGEAVSGPDGRYLLNCRHVPPEPSKYRQAMVLVRARGQSLAWSPFDSIAVDSQVDVTVGAEQLMQVRLVDKTGQPAAAVAVKYAAITPAKGDVGAHEPLENAFSLFQAASQATPPHLKTDDNGLLSIPFVPMNHGVLFESYRRRQVCTAAVGAEYRSIRNTIGIGQHLSGACEEYSRWRDSCAHLGGGKDF